MDPLTGFIALGTLLGALSTRSDDGKLRVRPSERYREEADRAWEQWAHIVDPQAAHIIRDLISSHPPPGQTAAVLPPGWRWEPTGPQALPTAVETTPLENVVGVYIRHMNPEQIEAWSQHGKLICPHGSNDLTLVRLAPMSWEYFSATRATFNVNDGDIHDSVGEDWLECTHGPDVGAPGAWWPPGDMDPQWHDPW